MPKVCTQCQELDALNTELTKTFKALIKGEADDKYPLLKEWLKERDKKFLDRINLALSSLNNLANSIDVNDVESEEMFNSIYQIHANLQSSSTEA